ncbi:hypothetical protein PAMP_000739 [Pampus punctatissimus]
MDSLNCISYNVKGINSPIKRKKILNQLKKMHCSIAMIQETHLTEKEHLKLKREWVDQVYSSSFENRRKRGVAILLNRSVYFSHVKTIDDKEGRFVIVIGTIGGSKVTLVNLYAPNEDCPNFFKMIASLLADKAEGIILIGGDFNCILRQNVDRLPAGVGPMSKKSITLHAMMDELGLVDVWRHLHPREKDYTFMSHVHGSHSRLDMFLISGTDIYRTSECNIEPITISDHAPVTVKIRIGPNRQFKYWRLNVSLLNDEAIQQELREKLIEYLKSNDNDTVSPSTLWEAAKVVMRGNIIAISSRLKKQRLAQQVELEREIKKLEAQYQQSKTHQVLVSLKEKTQKLDDILTYKAEGALRFADRKYYEFGNRASRLLAFQLRKAQANRTVHKIKCPNNNQMLTQPKDISEAFATYYQKLYTAEDQPHKKEKIESFLDSINLTRLTEEEADTMTRPITEEEIRENILKLKNNKSPGVDGFPGEYYKTLINELTPVLCRVYNYALTEGHPPGSWSDAVISVIHKDNKDPTLCTSYRPISLLGVDLKILTSIIANRIQKYIRKLIKPDQTGFINNRQGTDNVRRALNLQSLAAKRGIPSMFLSLDAEKAFDRVDWTFLEQTLSRMGFNDVFVRWIKTFYKSPRSRIRVNGHCSEFFPLGRGTRQGDALSPSLFAISIEPLAELIRADPQIQGILDEGNNQHKVALFADDILVFLENPITSVPALLHDLNKYSEVSGYKVNTNKSEAMMIVGNWPPQLDDLVSFRRSKQGFRYLGVFLTPKTTQLFSSNYDRLIKEIKKDLNRWDMLPLSFFGRIESVRMNILPRLLFLFQSLPILVPQSVFKLLEKLISKFIWQNQRPRIRLKVLMAAKERGGLNLPNLKFYYWAAQLRAVVTWVVGDLESGWVSIEQNSMPGIQLSSLPFLSQQSQKKLKINNLWIVHTLKVWNLVQKQLKGVVTLSRAMPIAGNVEFLPSVYDRAFKRWAESGLIIINQLLDGPAFKSFSQLRDKFDLPSSDLYRYLQIRHYVTKNSDWENIQKEPTNIESYFIHLFEHRSLTKKQISYMYKKLMMDMSDNTQHIKQQWELELNAIIDDNSWENICSRCHKGVGSQLYKEFDWKVKIKFFRAPLTTFVSKNNPSNKCWRNCGMVGDHTHIFWDCPKLQTFWKNVKKELEKILAVDLPMDSLLFLLDVFPDHLLTTEQCYILHILLMIARKIITINWMKTDPPMITQWLQKIKHVYMMEYMTAQLQLKVPAFMKRWTPVRNYLT